MSLFVGPREGYGVGAHARSAEGAGHAGQVRGVRGLSYAIEDVARAAETGIRSFLVADLGLLTLLRDMQSAGELPADIGWKISIAMAPSNPAALVVLAGLGATTINVPSDVTTAELAEMRAATSLPIDLYLESPDSLGGVVRGNELADLVAIGAPLYAKFGLRNSRLLYPAGEHLYDEAIAIARAKVARAAVALEWLARLGSDLVQSEAGSRRPPRAASRPFLRGTHAGGRGDPVVTAVPTYAPMRRAFMSGKRKLLAVTAALAVVAVAGGGAVVTSAQSAPAAFAVSAATGCTSSKGTLKYGIAGAGISQLDPNTINFAGQVPLQTLLYNGLSKYDRNMDVVPDLATKWRASKDLKTWFFTLRKGVKYSTGRAFTAERRAGEHSARARSGGAVAAACQREGHPVRARDQPVPDPDQARQPERDPPERARRHQDERHQQRRRPRQERNGNGAVQGRRRSFRTSRWRSCRTRITSAAARACSGSSSSASPTRRRW